jgi:hypothetical protein
MSWIQKELRKRERHEARAAARAQAQVQEQRDSELAGETAAAAAAKAQALWDRFEATNAALPERLQLKREIPGPHEFPSERSVLTVLLCAKNGACIGYSGDAIRYLWPKKNASKSNNFWIRWQAGRGYRISRRTQPSLFRSSSQERAFREASVDHILRCLVTDQQVKFRSVCKRRLGLF